MSDKTGYRKIILSLWMMIFLAMTDAAYAEKIKVIVSIAPLADFARQVGGDRIDVKLLLPPGVSPHVYEPTPKTLKYASEAQVFIKIGGGLEFWAEKIVKASGNKKLILVNASPGESLIRDPHAHNTVRIDPHIWLDPLIAVNIVSKIEKALIEADPQGAILFRKNATAYRDILTRLDREIAARVAKFSIKEYVTFHPAWNYFSRRYDLRVAGVIEEAPGKEPTPKHIAGIIREINRIGSMAVFVEPQFNPKIAEVIAKESKARVLYLDPIGGMPGRETYVEMMKYNIGVMERVMR